MAAGRLVSDAEHLLRDWLKNSPIKPGQRLPSERALSKELGAQHYAVNRAMSRLIAEGTVLREGYKLTLAGAQEPMEAGRHACTCHLVVSRRSVHLPGYRKVAKELGIELLIHPWQAAEEAVSLLEQLNQPDTQGVIFDPPFGQATALWEPDTQRLVQQGIPVVCVGQEAAHVSSVLADSSRALETIFNHLAGLGHRELAFLTVSPWTPSSAEIYSHWKWQCEKNQLAGSKDRILPINNSRLLPEEAKSLARSFQSGWKKVTALVAYTDNEYPVQHLLDEFQKEGIEVPGRLSLFFVGDTKSLQFATPPVSATAMDMRLIQETAYLLILRALRKKKEIGLLPPPCIIRVQESLILRQSTAEGPHRKQPQPPAKKSPAGPVLPPKPVHPADAGDIENIGRRPYDLTARTPETRFRPVDLSAHVNRPLNFRRGWLGDLPLRHFLPGRHVIHGVPFQVLGGSSRSDCGAIVFHSLLNTTGSSRKLPTTLSLPLEAKAAAVYFLHGCGYAKYLNRFASYTFYSGRKKLGEVPLVALGNPPPNTTDAELAAAIPQANIQDWWPDYPHYDFNHARVLPFLENENADTVNRHVYLYTLEWINPFPQKTITHIEIRADAEQSTTLGVLALTLLGP